MAILSICLLRDLLPGELTDYSKQRRVVVCVSSATELDVGTAGKLYAYNRMGAHLSVSLISWLRSGKMRPVDPGSRDAPNEFGGRPGNLAIMTSKCVCVCHVAPLVNPIVGTIFQTAYG